MARRRVMLPLYLSVVLVFLSAFASNSPAPGSYKGCAAEGDGGDTILNALKNRSEEASSPAEKTIADILSFPKSTQLGPSHPRRAWSLQNLD